eukprot:11491855-Heterocapsa_arctica.AAC.1
MTASGRLAESGCLRPPQPAGQGKHPFMARRVDDRAPSSQSSSARSPRSRWPRPCPHLVERRVL